MYENRNYVIFNVSELDSVDFDTVLETSAETVRRSVSGEKTFVKWEGETPECVGNLATKEGPYTHAEILEILSGPDWTSPVEELT